MPSRQTTPAPMAESLLLRPEWPLPPGVHAFVSTRQGGVSEGTYASFNLGLFVDDDPDAVRRNHALLKAEIARLTGIADVRLQWMRQVHGVHVHEIDASATGLPEADAIYCTQPGIACAVLTADCLPVLMASDDGLEVAVAHAGWRGLVEGVLERAASRLRDPKAASAWLGPAIGPCHFEVGGEVREAFLQRARPDELDATRAAFRPGAQADKWYGDLYALARIRLARVGMARVYGNVCCTVCDQDRWYSYRGEARTGRFASLIVFTPVHEEQS